MPPNELPEAMRDKFSGLLTAGQKQAGYFVSEDEDFMWLRHRRNGNPDIIAVWLLDDVKVKQVREMAQKHLAGNGE